MLRVLATAFAALTGLAFGSFLNVCLTRWPQEESIATPRSHCRTCNRTLAWWENIPLASWLALRGRCRTCNAPIGVRYPVVEFAVAVLWGAAAWQSFYAFSPPWFAIGMCVFFWLAVALAILDAEHLWLPDFLTLGGTALGFVWSFLGMKIAEKALRYPAGSWRNLKDAGHIVIAILAAAGLVYLIRGIYWLVRRREGIGLGDAKLMGMLAAWLGFSRALLCFGLAAIIGAFAALVLLALRPAHKTEEHWGAAKLPLGTFLCIAGIVAGLWGNQIITAYLHWAGFY
jgi:leader peptidase (prepilin peptidase)/N-methyltransferase